MAVQYDGGILVNSVLDEISQFKGALRSYFKSKKQSCVIFERISNLNT